MAGIRKGLLLLALIALCTGPHLAYARRHGDQYYSQSGRDAAYRDGESEQGYAPGGEGESHGSDYGWDDNVRLAFGSPQEEAFTVAPESEGKVFSWWQWCDKEKFIKYVVLIVPGSWITATTFGEVTAQHLHVGAPRNVNTTDLLHLHFAGSGDEKIWDVKTTSGWPILAKGILDDAYVAKQFENATGSALKLTTAYEVWSIIKENKAYYNLHTVKFPDGEARGQVDWSKMAGFVSDAKELIGTLKPTKPDSGYEGYQRGQQDRYRQDRPYIRDSDARAYGRDTYRQDRPYVQDRSRQDRPYTQVGYPQNRMYSQDTYGQVGYPQNRMYSQDTYGQDRPYRQDPQYSGDRVYMQERAYSQDRFRQDRTQSDFDRQYDRAQGYDNYRG